MSRKPEYKKREEVLKSTTDNWYPNYENDKVMLMYVGLLADGDFRVAAWGNDDFGIERDFDKEEDDYKMFLELKKKRVITKDGLYNLDFTNF